MAKTVYFLESKVSINEAANAAEPTGAIEAVLTTWGAREGADGRRFNYQAAPFQEWANALAESGKPLPMYFQHMSESTMPIGQWDEFEFTDEAMIGKGRIFTNTTAGRDVYTILKESPNLIGGVSVGAYAEEYEMVDEDGNQVDSMDEDGYFCITKGGLAEVSIVMNPNNQMANISSLEYFRADGSADLKVFEQALREAGFARKDAKKAASIFGGAMAKRDVEPEAAEPKSDKRDAQEDAANEAAILAALTERELLKALEAKLHKRI